MINNQALKKCGTTHTFNFAFSWYDVSSFIIINEPATYALYFQFIKFLNIHLQMSVSSLSVLCKNTFWNTNFSLKMNLKKIHLEMLGKAGRGGGWSPVHTKARSNADQHWGKKSLIFNFKHYKKIILICDPTYAAPHLSRLHTYSIL